MGLSRELDLIRQSCRRSLGLDELDEGAESMLNNVDPNPTAGLCDLASIGQPLRPVRTSFDERTSLFVNHQLDVLLFSAE